ncbi:hypothetical protein ADUPG1_007655 [Aduncisulcus paluster]|uniref:Uncharacterized protein n=1 Tax=Aduncisulcus paluster TaxID=2918883 RepID=A0ABQ5KP44_9EUKA|nr:hypothetical protein ADUPG1_007655 [Aduncisulcus paluster]|eukprot:gnl/Carplike_NY0171/8536_a11842_255.p1 GENE.gnl/Carplike_NY0171/8536_a11842_255~~gnl/Carplike_NY0171/8536_a11842_255.p1  ORF type:complete len:188 (-),score=33.57 gnl/Carplike_NY0171/8536_a11842_255:37-600(-)
MLSKIIFVFVPVIQPKLINLTLSSQDISHFPPHSVIQILAKGVDASYSYSYSSISTGLTSLSLSGCALDKLEDVLDLTPIHAEDDATSNFKLISLDLSSNNISDVSVLFTEDIISSSNLTTLDISDNNICDINNVVTLLQDQFSGISISSATQSCPDDCIEKFSIENGSEPLIKILQSIFSSRIDES